MAAEESNDVAKLLEQLDPLRTGAPSAQGGASTKRSRRRTGGEQDDVAKAKHELLDAIGSWNKKWPPGIKPVAPTIGSEQLAALKVPDSMKRQIETAYSTLLPDELLTNGTDSIERARLLCGLLDTQPLDMQVFAAVLDALMGLGTQGETKSASNSGTGIRVTVAIKYLVVNHKLLKLALADAILNTKVLSEKGVNEFNVVATFKLDRRPPTAEQAGGGWTVSSLESSKGWVKSTGEDFEAAYGDEADKFKSEVDAAVIKAVDDAHKRQQKPRIGFRQFSGTCYFNAALNALALSKDTRVLLMDRLLAYFEGLDGEARTAFLGAYAGSERQVSGSDTAADVLFRTLYALYRDDMPPGLTAWSMDAMCSLMYNPKALEEATREQKESLSCKKLRDGVSGGLPVLAFIRIMNAAGIAYDRVEHRDNWIRTDLTKYKENATRRPGAGVLLVGVITPSHVETAMQTVPERLQFAGFDYQLACATFIISNKKSAHALAGAMLYPNGDQYMFNSWQDAGEAVKWTEMAELMQSEWLSKFRRIAAKYEFENAQKSNLTYDCLVYVRGKPLETCTVEFDGDKLASVQGCSGLGGALPLPVAQAFFSKHLQPSAYRHTVVINQSAEDDAQLLVEGTSYAKDGTEVKRGSAQYKAVKAGEAVQVTEVEAERSACTVKFARDKLESTEGCTGMGGSLNALTLAKAFVSKYLQPPAHRHTVVIKQSAEGDGQLRVEGTSYDVNGKEVKRGSAKYKEAPAKAGETPVYTEVTEVKVGGGRRLLGRPAYTVRGGAGRRYVRHGGGRWYLDEHRGAYRYTDASRRKLVLRGPGERLQAKGRGSPQLHIRGR